MAEFVEGADKVIKQLRAAKTALGIKALRSATSKATTPVLRQMRAKIPKGKRPHKTYNGILVSGGFASRQLTKRSRFNRARGSASSTLGVKKQAFYAIQFYDERDGRTPYRIDSRRVKSGRRTVKKNIKAYTLKAVPWFSKVFERNRRQMEKSLFEGLSQKLIAAVKRGN